MKFALFFGIFLLSQIPKYDPNGLWKAETGSVFSLQTSGGDLKVHIVEGSNPRFAKYEVDLRNSKDEVNTYEGTGYFIAKFDSGKECKFDTNWKIIVVSPDRILGAVSNIIPNPDTCEVKDKYDIQLDLSKQ
jgi:hypothetical protein